MEAISRLLAGHRTKAGPSPRWERERIGIAPLLVEPTLDLPRFEPYEATNLDVRNATLEHEAADVTLCGS
jgi:hypothetical protein